MDGVARDRGVQRVAVRSWALVLCCLARTAGAQAPAAPSPPPGARLTFTRALVDAYTPERHPARPGDALRPGDKVATLAHSSAEIAFADGTRVQLGEETALEVQQGAEGPEGLLYSGSLRADVVGGLAVDTPAGRVRLGPGAGEVTVDAARATRVAVYQGEGRLAAGGKEVVIAAGLGSHADKGHRPQPPRRLPAPPAWAEPPPPLELFVDKPVVMNARVAAGEGAGATVAMWHMQVARDERFNDLVFDQQVPAIETALRVRGLGPGAYFARVMGLDADQMEGAPGPVARTAVRCQEGERVGMAEVCGGRLVAVAATATATATQGHGAAPLIRLPMGGLGVEVGAVSSVLFGNDGVGTFTGGIGVEAGLRLDLPFGAAVVGLRPGYEHTGFWGGGLQARDCFELSMPVGYRLPAGHGISPYVFLAPQMEVDGLRIAHRDAVMYRVHVGFWAALGAQVQLATAPRHNGALFLEFGYRYLDTPASPVADEGPDSYHGPLLSAGYRIGL